MVRHSCSKIIRSRRAKPEPSSSEQSSDSEDSSSENAAWMKSTIGQLTSLKDSVTKAATTIDELLTMLKSVSDNPGSTTTSSVSTMTQTDDVTVHRAPRLDGEASVSGLPTSLKTDSQFNSGKIQSRKLPPVPRKDHAGYNHSGVRGTRRYIELFVTRVHRSTGFRNLENYVARYVTDFSLEKISHANASQQSFVLTVPESYIHDVLDSGFWPRNIECRRFKRPISGRLASNTRTLHPSFSDCPVERGVGVS